MRTKLGSVNIKGGEKFGRPRRRWKVDIGTGNIINFARVQRLGWYGGMEETRMVKAIYSWKPISKRPKGRPKIRWEDDVKKDIQRLKVPNWKTLVQDRRRGKEVVEKAKTLH